MIGYSLSATGNHGFKFNKDGWSEGSLWLLKTAMDRSGNEAVGHIGAHEALIDAIEGQFTKLRQLKFDKVADGARMNYDLNVFGDFIFSFKFREGKDAAVTRYQLAKKIASSGNEMGDQVALTFFECILEYQRHYLLKCATGDWTKNFLNVWIKL
jgi:hypothetical protein